MLKAVSSAHTNTSIVYIRLPIRVPHHLFFRHKHILVKKSQIFRILPVFKALVEGDLVEIAPKCLISLH